MPVMPGCLIFCPCARGFIPVEFFYAAHLAASIPYDEADCSGPCAFLIGNEGNGLTDEAADAASCKVHIPMEGQIESLNAAMAAGILMFEASRQRRRGGM